MSDWIVIQGLACLTLVFASVPANAAPTGFAKVLTVAADGSGDFATIKSAIDTIPRSNCERVLIEVRDGVYREKVRIEPDRITLRGQSRKGTQLKFDAPREDYDRQYDAIGPGVMNVFGDDLIIQRMTIENTQPNETHAFAIYGQPNRLILDDCEVLGSGGDTLSLWNTPYGMYYHRNCHFKGGVDFVCPRGWCFICDSQFQAVGRSAILWHDGHLDPSGVNYDRLIAFPTGWFRLIFHQQSLIEQRFQFIEAGGLQAAKQAIVWPNGRHPVHFLCQTVCRR